MYWNTGCKYRRLAYKFSEYISIASNIYRRCLMEFTICYRIFRSIGYIVIDTQYGIITIKNYC